MDADFKYRAEEFTRLYTFGWNIGDDRRYHWGKKAYYLVDGGEYGYSLYNEIQSVPLGQRGQKFSALALQGKFSHQCEEVFFAPKTYYVDPNTGSYRDPYYDSGTGPMQGIGEMFSTINWEEVFGWVILIGAYLIISVIGAFAFPPAMICLWLSDGNLNTCSMGIWGNGYAQDQSKFADGTQTDTAPVTPTNDSTTVNNDDPNTKTDPTVSS